MNTIKKAMEIIFNLPDEDRLGIKDVARALLDANKVIKFYAEAGPYKTDTTKAWEWLKKYGDDEGWTYRGTRK